MDFTKPAALLIASWLLAGVPAGAQQRSDSAAAASSHPRTAIDSFPWRHKVRYGGGPSVGPPVSDFAGAPPPAQWCLTATRPAPGDLGRRNESWGSTSRAWLRQVLSDPTEWGDVWRKVLGGMPRLAPQDSIIEVTDEDTCRKLAEILNRELLGWAQGPPPVVVFRVGDYLIAYPSNASMGEWGLAVSMSREHEIRGVAAW